MSEPMQFTTIETGRSSPATKAGLVLESLRTTLDQDPIVLGIGRYHLGSGAECEVRIAAAGVAARHCLVVVGPRKTVVKSFSPLTWINDAPVREGTLQPGDRIVLGPVEFAVREPYPGEQSRVSTPPAPHEAQDSGTEQPVSLADAAARRELETAAHAAAAEAVRQHSPSGVRAVASSGAAPAVIPQPHHAAPRPQTGGSPLHSATEEWNALAESRAALQEQRSYLAQLAGTLEHRERELTARESEIRVRWDELQGERARADAANARLEADRTELEQQRAALSNEAAAAEQRRIELVRAQSELDARAAGVQEREAAWRVADERLQAEREALAAQRRQLESDQASLAAHRDALANRERDVQEQDSRLAAARGELARERGEQERVRAELHEQAEQVAEARAALDAARQEFQAEWQQIDAARAELAQLRSDIDLCRDDSLAARRLIDVERDRLETTRTQVAAERAAVEVQTQELAARHSELANHQALADRARIELQHLDQERVAVAELQAAARRAQDDLRNEQEAVEQMRASVEGERSELESERQSLADERADWDSRQSEWNADRTRFEEAQARIAREREEWQRQRDAWRADGEALAAQRDALQAERDQLVELLRTTEAQRDAVAAEGAGSADLPNHADAHGELVEQQAALAREWERLRFDRDVLEETRAALEAGREQLEAARAQADAELAAQRAQEDRDFAERQQLVREREQIAAEWAQLETERQAFVAERGGVEARLSELAPMTQRDEASFGGHDEFTPVMVGEPSAWDGASGTFGGPGEPEAGRDAGFGDVAAPAFVSEAPAPEGAFDEHPAPSDSAAPDPVSDEGLRAAANGPVDEANTPTWIVEPGQLAAIADCVVEPACGYEQRAHAGAVQAPETPVFESVPDSVTERAAHAAASKADAPAAVKALRSQLAEMFGISPDAAFGHGRPAGDDVADVPAHEEQFSDEPPADLGDGVQDAGSGNAEQAVVQADAESATVPAELRESPDMSARAAGSASAPQPGGDDSHADSVSAYMERLLARSRTAAASSAPPVVEPVRRRRSTTESSDKEQPAVTPAPAVAAPPPLEIPSAPPKSIAPEEKEALRANIDSFRELANASARSAVAKHESKKLRTMVQIKVVLTIIAAALTVVLFLANSLGRVSYGLYVLASGFAAVVMAFDLARTVLAFYRWKSVETANLWEAGEEPSDDPPATDSGAAGVADDNTTSDLPIVPAATAATASADAAPEPPGEKTPAAAD